MTIEEKAKQVSGAPKLGAPEMFTPRYRQGEFKGFKDGAQWMLDKAIKWLSDNAQNYYEDASQHDNCYYDDEGLISAFKKAMEK